MTVPKIQDKQQAIVDAAIAVFSSRGFWNTPTSLISKTAGVADGTLFNYFKTKDDLISEVYLEIKREVADELMNGLDAYETFHDKMQHIWTRYIHWGVNNPDKFKVLQQIGLSYDLADEVKAQGNEPFTEISRLAGESIAKGELRSYPVDYLAALMDGQTIATIRFISLNPEKQADYVKIGFDILWNGVIR